MAKVSLRAYNREIEAMVDRGQLDEAIAHCQHILKTFPKHLETYRLLGKAYLEYKRHNEAVDIFSRVLAAEPNDFVSNVGMSIIRDEQGKMDDAIWHMERAFETQPSNPAIQSELQRLYGRRDGIQPPRIRMTRGALAHMYVQGELYPQAISEIKNVLKDDPGRSDMSVLLARAYHRSGQKNQAADEAAAVLRRYPYCLDANRVLVEIAGSDRPETAQVHRQRVIELDPYAAQVTGSIFQSNEVGDNAVGLEHLEWNGQPVLAQSDWDTTKAIAPEGGFGPGTPEPPSTSQAEPDWLKMGFTDSVTSSEPKPTVIPPVSESSSRFDLGTAGEPAQPTPEEDIPDFLRAAGWGKSTGEFDESKSMFEDEPVSSASDAASIIEGDLPDWVKAMAPPPTSEPAQPTGEEELPDWIKNIGTGALSAGAATSTDNQSDWLTGSDEPTSSSSVPVSDEEPEWLKGSDESAQAITSEQQPDWMKGFEQQAAAPESLAADDSLDWLKGADQSRAPEEQPDWMKGLEPQSAAAPSPAGDDTMDWLKGLDQPETPQAAPGEGLDWLGSPDRVEPPQSAASNEQPDWMKSFEETPSQQPEPSAELDWLSDLGKEPEAAPEPAPALEQPDWLTQFGSQPEESTAETPIENAFDFLDDIPEKPVTEPPATTPVTDTSSLGKSDQERDDSFAWLEALAAKQGASEGLLTKPEERLQEEPDWVKQAKGLTPESAPQEQAPVQPASKVEDLGKSQQEIDDSLAWLENLAAKQGATEGLLTKPEERLQDEPDWVKQAKGITPQAVPEEQPPVAQPAPSTSELGKSQQEIDDSLAWLENLAAKQGATEGLLTKPEERLQEEPEWVKQAKAAPPSTSSTVQPPPVEPAPVKDVHDLGKSDQERDDSFAWLEALAAKQGASEGLLTKPEERLEEEPDWVKQAKSGPQEPAPVTSAPAARPEDLGKSQQEIDDSLAWLENLAAKQGATEGLLTKPEERLQEEPEWVKQAKSAPPESAAMPATPIANLEEPARSEQERADSFAWLEDLAAEQEATEGSLTGPEDQIDQEPELTEQAMSVPQHSVEPEPVQPEPASSADDTRTWLRNLEQEEYKPEPGPSGDETAIWFKKLEETPQETPEAQPEAADELPSWLSGLDEEPTPQPTPAADTTMMWLRDLEAPEPESASPETPTDDDVPAWLKGIDEEEKAPVADATLPEAAPAESQVRGEFDWLDEIEEESAASAAAETAEEESLPAWLRGVDEETALPETGALRGLTGWMRDETGEGMAEPTKIEPTRATDWQPVEERQPEPIPEPVAPEPPRPEPQAEPAVVPPVEEPVKPRPVPKKPKPSEPKPEPYKEPLTTRGAGMSNTPIDPMLASARSELSRSNIPVALQTYEKLIKKGRFLDEVIFDLREALYRYPVEVSIWQALGDAYMRANRLQDALDAFTKAEELLR